MIEEPDEDQFDRVQRAVHAALSDVLSPEGDMVIKWVTLVETMGEDGSRALWTMAAADMKTWETLGFLEYARHAELARRIEDQLR